MINIFIFLAVYNFMNQGNPKSNSKHSLFDHFKRNLDLKCNIPKFDINTGILISESNKLNHIFLIKKIKKFTIKLNLTRRNQN